MLYKEIERVDRLERIMAFKKEQVARVRYTMRLEDVSKTRHL